MTTEPLRVELLTEGAELTSGDRNYEYGEPADNLANCAELWQAYLYGKYGEQSDASFVMTAEDVAWLNVLQKIARTFTGRASADTYTDAAVYSAIAYECRKGKE